MGVYRHPESKFWWCRFEFRGQEYRRSTDKVDKREAQAEERRIRSAVEGAAAPARRRGVGPLSDLALEDIKRAVREGADEDQSTHTITSRWTPLLAFFGSDRDIATIEPLEIEGYVSARRKWPNRKGGVTRVSGQTIRRELASLKRGYVIAKKKGWIDRLPDSDVWPKLKKDPKNVAMKGKLRSIETLQKLFAEANDRRLQHTQDGKVRDHLVFAAVTGLRAEELPNVRMSWVQVLSQEKADALGLPAILMLPDDGTKTNEERFIGLPQEGYDAVLRRQETLLHPDGSLFPHKSLGQWLRRYSAKIEVSPAITLRDLRHTYSTLGMAGTNDATAVMKSMGHADLKTTEIYQSATIARVTRVGVSVAQAVFGTAREVRTKEKAGTAKPAQEEDEPAKSLILWSARLAQLDRALVSEALEIVDFAEFSDANLSQNIQQDPAQPTPIPAQLAGTGLLQAGDWLHAHCGTCTRDVEVLEHEPRECPICGGRALEEVSYLVG